MGLALVGIILVTLLFFVWFVAIKRQIQALKNVKKGADRDRRVQLTKSLRLAKWGIGVSIVLVMVTGGLTLFGINGNQVYLTHVHGLGFSKDGKKILIPSHDGLKAYEAGTWTAQEGAKHDYMGFVTVDDGFYSSGHPEEGSDLKNPLGLVKSTDVGKSLQMLGLEGETDFHLMTAGFNSHVVYAITPQPNSKMYTAGLYYSNNDGDTWTKSEMKGISEEPTSIAAHPTEESIVVIGTPTGVFLSKDYGKSFEKIVSEGQTTALSFNKQGDLFIAGYLNQPYLQKMDMISLKAQKITIPALTEDAIAYFAQNPANDNQWTFATFNRDVYLSDDKGQKWKMIAEQGKTISEENTQS